MRPENLYKLTAEMLKNYDAATSNNYAEKILEDPAAYVDGRRSQISAMNFYGNAAEILADCLGKMSETKTSATAAAKRLFKAGRPDLAGIFKEENAFCICNGYVAARLAKDLPTVTHIDTTIKLNQIFSGIEPGQEIEIPDAGTLKAAAIKHKNDRRPYVQDTPDGLKIGYNPRYMFDMLALFENPHLYYTAPKMPLYIIADNGDGIIMPINISY